MNERTQRFTPPGPVLGLLALSTMLFVGCFGYEYESRLEETGRWYGYLHDLDTKLGPPWAGANVTYLRTPLGFKPRFDLETESETPLPLTPEFVETEIEGLNATWTTECPIGGGAKATAYLLQIDNNALWLKETRRTPHPALEFVERYRRGIDRLLNWEPSGAETKRNLPEEGRFGTPRQFTVTQYKVGETIDGVEYEAREALYDKGDIKGVLLLLVPKTATNKSQLESSFDLALETLEFTERTPKLGDKKKDAAGGAPGVGAPTGGGADF